MNGHDSMRIIHTDTDDIDNPLSGGQPVRTFEVYRRLAARHPIQVLTASYLGAKPSTTRDGVHYQTLGWTMPYWGLSSHLSYLARLPSKIKQMPHDLVVEEFVPPLGFCNLQRYTHQPVISIVQSFPFAQWQARYKLPFEAMMRKRAQFYMPRNLIVQSQAMGDYFRDLIPQANIVNIPCGIDQTQFSKIVVVGDYALYLGRLDMHLKGLDDLLLAWKLLVEQGVTIPLRIAGDGRDMSRLKELTKVLGLQHCVTFFGKVSGKDKQALIAGCRMMVMPSRQETFGIAALEAMACSKPVVAYDIPHLNELLRADYSTMVTLGNTQALSLAVANYWQSPSMALVHGEQAYKVAQSYLWDKVATEQEAFYQDVIKSSKHKK